MHNTNAIIGETGTGNSGIGEPETGESGALHVCSVLQFTTFLRAISPYMGAAMFFLVGLSSAVLY